MIGQAAASSALSSAFSGVSGFVSGCAQYHLFWGLSLSWCFLCGLLGFIAGVFVGVSLYYLFLRSRVETESSPRQGRSDDYREGPVLAVRGGASR